MTIRDRFKLHSKALLKNVNDSPWYTMYANEDGSDLVTCISLIRATFEQLLSAFKSFYIFKHSSKEGERTPRVKDHHCVWALLLHTYCCLPERKTWSEMFGIAPTTLHRTSLEAEEALLLTLNFLPEAIIEWPSHELQVELAKKVQRKEPLIMGRWGMADGKNYDVAASENAEIQNGTDNAWLHRALITGVTLFGADGCVMWAKLLLAFFWHSFHVSSVNRSPSGCLQSSL
jgi:hypothetical protein